MNPFEIPVGDEQLPPPAETTHWFATIEEHHGPYTFHQDFLVEAVGFPDDDALALHIASNWYRDKDHSIHGDRVEYDGGDIVVEAAGLKPVTAGEFEVLARFLLIHCHTNHQP